VSAVEGALVAAPRRVLVLRFSSVGDLILTSPAIEALHRAWPDTEIIFAVREGYEGLVAHSPYVHELAVLRRGEGVLSFARRLRALGADALLDIHNTPRCRALRLLLPAPRRSVWAKRDWRDTVAVKLGLRPWRAGIWLSDRYHRAVEALVGRPLPRGRLRHWLGPDDAARGREALSAAGVDPDAPIVGMSPGAAWATKRWPVGSFAAVAREALARGHQVVISGGPDERALCQQMIDAAPGAVFVHAKLDVWGGIISHCRAFVANDSGPMHMARGLGVPTLAVFGSTDGEQFDLRGHARLASSLPCAPCHFYGRRRCPRLHFRCMRELTPEAGWGLLEPLLAPGPPVVVNG